MQPTTTTPICDGSETNVEDLRRSRRVEVDISGEITIDGQPPEPVRVTNLSETGCYLRTETPPPIESRCEVKLFYEREQPTRFLEVAGRVAHRQRGGCGFEFTIIDRQTQRRLARIVR
jgi:hypothetical protein